MGTKRGQIDLSPFLSSALPNASASRRNRMKPGETGAIQLGNKKRRRPCWMNSGTELDGPNRLSPNQLSKSAWCRLNSSRLNPPDCIPQFNRKKLAAANRLGPASVSQENISHNRSCSTTRKTKEMYTQPEPWARVFRGAMRIAPRTQPEVARLDGYGYGYGMAMA